MSCIFDIVIPIGPNDKSIIYDMVNFTKQNIIGYRNIYLVSYDPLINIEDCITINENIYPFSKNTIREIIGDSDRIGWYLQQLIKLYSFKIINGLLDNYLVIDSDTFFLKPTSFFKDNIPLYNIGYEYHIPYFDHMIKLHPTLLKQTNYSGITHHMIFQKHILQHLFDIVELYNNNIFWISFLKCINEKDIHRSGASEYEIYFNFLHIYYDNKFHIRVLEWDNTNINTNTNTNLNYISNHWYIR